MKSVRVVCAHDCPDMCSLIVHVDGGKVVRVQGDADHPYTAGFACGKVNRDADLVNSPERLATPLKRTGPKGSGQFKPITWDEALDEIAANWKAIIKSDGPLAILGYAYSAHQGLMNRGLVNGLFHALGTSRLQAGTVCDTCCEAAWDVTVGPVGGADPESVVHSDLVVAWGADLAATNVHFWALAEEQRKKRGIKIVVIDPRRTRSAKAADLYLPIRIGTDAALALGVMHILVRDKLADRDYIARHTLGFDQVEREILPKFTPARTAEITGLSVADIEKLAAMYGNAKAALIRLGEGMTRLTHGGQALRTVVLLPGVSGHYAVKGGGALLLTAASCDLNYAAIRKPSGPATARMVNHLRLGEELLNMKGPPIRALYVSANNPAVTCPEVHKVQKGLMREDLFTVVHDPFMTDTAKYADIVLPAASYLETDDLYRAYGAYWMQWGRKAVEPAGEARSNVDVAQALAKRMGLTDTIFALSPEDAARELFKGSTGPASKADPAKLFAGEPIHIAHDLDGQPFKTPSGKLEFYSEQLAKQGLPPMPDWVPDPVETAEAGKWPLRLLTAPGYFQAHTAFSGVGFLRTREGKPFCILHPEDAAKRGLKDGDQVRVFNDRGEIGLMLKVVDEVQPGVLLVPGQRPTGEALSGTINMLCSDRYTDMGEGATYQSTWLEVGAWKAAARVAAE
ncbi:MAG: molybdopterin-dependent oxidoreductase [Reyranella sp.]|uniref:molybdopterin-containing oxidoreductase family protein n=1 Tax=Reyranella sp. TaxID=1929291 RepID=UPI0027301F84|nr:molybdopterin-dependent oxidoreductase [Reyranella sp.]MDP1967418.1 molybdopterin-dependent oxidoreductase [Reyranella sp.]MDP2377410.1 molybdopterin-dependent oxidoreductase [Reyranella sp.]